MVREVWDIQGPFIKKIFSAEIKAFLLVTSSHVTIFNQSESSSVISVKIVEGIGSPVQNRIHHEGFIKSSTKMSKKQESRGPN